MVILWPKYLAPCWYYTIISGDNSMAGYSTSTDAARAQMLLTWNCDPTLAILHMVELQLEIDIDCAQGL